jgi:hypothetical protein
MTLRNDTELANTEQKLARLQDMIARAQNEPGPGQAVEVRSLTRLANELREEIVRYKASMRRAAPHQ